MVNSETITIVVMAYDFYTTVKSYFFQLVYFINVIILKFIGRTPEETLTSDKIKRDVKNFSEIPGPKPLPIFGTLLTSSAFGSTDLMKSNEEYMKKYGKIVKEEHYWNFPIIMLLDADDQEKAMKLVGNFRPSMEIMTMYRSSRPDRYDNSGLVNTQGEEWERLHKAFNPIISKPNFANSLIEASDEMAMDFLNLLNSSGPVIQNFGDFLGKFILEAALYNSFGKRMGFLGPEELIDERLNVFIQVHETYWKAFHKSTYGYPWWKYFPTKVWTEFVEAETTMIDIIDHVMQESIKEDDLGGALHGIMHAEGISYNDKRVILLEMTTGATEPVLVTAIYNLYWLSKHKHASKRLYEELKENMPSKDTPITDEILSRLTYLKACLMETSRMCPAAPNLARITEQPMELGGYDIPAYSFLLLQTWYSSMQDTSFYRAKEFLPERWMYTDGNVPPYQPHRRSLLRNFGNGKRACPGRRIALQHLTILMARVFRKYEVRFEKDLEVVYEYLISPVNPVNIEFYERDDD